MEGPVPEVDFSPFREGPEKLSEEQKKAAGQLYEVLTSHGSWDGDSEESKAPDVQCLLITLTCQYWFYVI